MATAPAHAPSPPPAPPPSRETAAFNSARKRFSLGDIRDAEARAHAWARDLQRPPGTAHAWAVEPMQPPLATGHHSRLQLPDVAEALRQAGLTEEALLRAGLGEARSERLRHALYVYSCGFGEMLHEQLGGVANHNGLRERLASLLWGAFVLLLERADSGLGYRSALAEVLRQHAADGDAAGARRAEERAAHASEVARLQLTADAAGAARGEAEARAARLQSELDAASSRAAAAERGSRC